MALLVVEPSAESIAHEYATSNGASGMFGGSPTTSLVTRNDPSGIDTPTFNGSVAGSTVVAPLGRMNDGRYANEFHATGSVLALVSDAGACICQVSAND